MDKNKQMAYFYIEKSEKLNFAPATTKLGDYFYSGYYVKKDL
jgi:TPR repeat protein